MTITEKDIQIHRGYVEVNDSLPGTVILMDMEDVYNEYEVR